MPAPAPILFPAPVPLMSTFTFPVQFRFELCSSHVPASCTSSVSSCRRPVPASVPVMLGVRTPSRVLSSPGSRQWLSRLYLPVLSILYGMSALRRDTIIFSERRWLYMVIWHSWNVLDSAQNKENSCVTDLLFCTRFVNVHKIVCSQRS